MEFVIGYLIIGILFELFARATGFYSIELDNDDDQHKGAYISYNILLWPVALIILFGINIEEE